MGAKPPPKRGAGDKALQFRLFLHLYRWLSRHFSPLLFSPPKTLGSHMLSGWKGFAQVFIDNHIKSVVGRVLLKILLIITPKARIILVIFLGKHRKNDAELLLTTTNCTSNCYSFLRRL